MRNALILLAIMMLLVSCNDSPDGPDDIGAMIEIPAGEFMMGCNEVEDAECLANEHPYHAVTLSAYKIGKYEVTASEYKKCVANGACNNSGEYYHYYTNADSEYCNLGASGKEKHPMQCVTWYGAQAYCAYLGQRLPTEAEWEKAARGTDGRKYPWGNEPTVSCDYAVMHDSNAGGDGCGHGHTLPVGSKEAGKSPYGLYDMVGNVWEWMNDWYGKTYYETTPINDPAGPETGLYRVMRGSANNGYGERLRTSARDGSFPHSSSSVSIGFRCAE